MKNEIGTTLWNYGSEKLEGKNCTIIFGIFKFIDVSDIASTKTSAPFIKRKNPIATNKIFIII